VIHSIQSRWVSSQASHLTMWFGSVQLRTVQNEQAIRGFRFGNRVCALQGQVERQNISFWKLDITQNHGTLPYFIISSRFPLNETHSFRTVEFQVLSVAAMMCTIFSNVMISSLVEVYQHSSEVSVNYCKTTQHHIFTS
jgi:hypothetical protein